MLMTEKIPQGCQACLYLATGEPVIRCLEDVSFLVICKATFHAVFAQPPLYHTGNTERLHDGVRVLSSWP